MFDGFLSLFLIYTNVVYEKSVLNRDINARHRNLFLPDNIKSRQLSDIAMSASSYPKHFSRIATDFLAVPSPTFIDMI
jgi:hypothetical protein